LVKKDKMVSVETVSHPLKGASSHLKVLIKTRLWLQVLIGLFLGIIAGIVLGQDVGLVSLKTSEVVTDWLALPGNLFLQLIKMIIIPLIVSSIILGITSSGKPNFLKKIGPRLALYFVITTIIATLIGLSVAFLIKPGNYLDANDLVSGNNISTQVSKFDTGSIPEKIVSILPDNPLEAMVNGDLLGIVLFGILFGLALMFIKHKHKGTILGFLGAVQEATMTIVKWAMFLAPYAVFGLMAKVTSKAGVQIFVGLGAYIITVLLGLFVLLLFYLTIIKLFTFYGPVEFLKAIFPVQLLAFSTSSSAAVMPLSIKTAEDTLKIKPAISRFIIPIGATINMDGSALYQVVATVFLAQVFGFELSLVSILLIIAVAVGASIGAPGVPGVGIAILATILESVGIPAAGVVLILGVDRILERSRTVLNVTGDLTATAFFDKRLGYLFGNK
jgi:Na+/H+-dicarboxylate symporter